MAASNMRMAESRASSLARIAAFMSSAMRSFFLVIDLAANHRRHAHTAHAHADALLVLAFLGGGGLALAHGGRLFVKLAAAYFSENAGLFARTAKTAQRYLERLVFFDTYGRHAVGSSNLRTGPVSDPKGGRFYASRRLFVTRTLAGSPGAKNNSPCASPCESLGSKPPA